MKALFEGLVRLDRSVIIAIITRQSLPMSALMGIHRSLWSDLCFKQKAEILPVYIYHRI
jgi:hypothetical protein